MSHAPAFRLDANRTLPAAPIRRTHIAQGTEQRTCEQHGAFEATLWALDPPSRAPFLQPFWSHCPTCDGERMRDADARDAEIRGGMSAAKMAAAARMRAAGIPERFAEASVWNWSHAMDQQRRAWEVAREYVSALDLALQTGRSLVFCGATGTGKTHLAIGVLRHVLEKGGTGLYTTAADLVGSIRATYARGADRTEQQVIDELVRVDVLVIDEIGRGLDTVHETTQLFRVLDGRYRRACKPVLLVSNLTKPKLQEFLGDALTDRLREGGGALLVFDWASQRSSRKREVYPS